jgi:hypothetical protein
MKTRSSIGLATLLVLIQSCGFAAIAWQALAPQEDLRKQIGTIIVTPGNGPNLAIADFIARSPGLEAATSTFNQVLWADLDFAAVSGLVGKSLYPKTLVPDPASLKFDDWSADPVKADYVAFGNLQNIGGAISADTYLYDVKTKQDRYFQSRFQGSTLQLICIFGTADVKRGSQQALLRQVDALRQAVFELRGLHVIGIATKAGIAPPGVRGVGPRTAQAAQPGHVSIVNLPAVQSRRQLVAIELRIVARAWYGSHVDQSGHVLRSCGFFRIRVTHT